MNNIDFFFIIGAAFTASIGHCIGMCGGIVVAYSSSKIDQKKSWLNQSISHLAYNLGRVTTYTILGVIFGFLGKVSAFSPTTKGILFIITGVLMVFAGLSLLGKLGFLNTIEVSVSDKTWFQKLFRKLMTTKSLGSFYSLGLLNGIIPCGLVYSFAIIAASTASPLWGGVVMAIFGLSTIPTLFLLGSVTKILQKGTTRKIMMKISAFLVITYGVFTLYKGYNFVVHPEMMKKKMEMMHQESQEGKVNDKCGGMKCAPGKCG
ncbi:MAG TPA: sulfite exporter TauE/SafE family protein [Lutibacter sp.]|nr:sulfite exporter TauE/SafE family protein [Lutibacter sp.]